jgi:16S rRNA (adenine1518-N6/adenine1519-N6)-dimethyltransferase
MPLADSTVLSLRVAMTSPGTDPEATGGDSDAPRGNDPDSTAGGRDPDALLARAGVRGDPRRDQHFLIDDRVLDRLPEHAIDAGFDTSHVLEIGAGTGALTDRLLGVADRVTAIERDPQLAAFCREEFAGTIEEGRLTVVADDALDIALPAFTMSVSNLPYGASSELLFALLPRRRPLVVTVQREFAERLVAEPGSAAYGRLSVTAGHYAASEIVEIVPPAAFAPPPAVESAVVRLRPREPDYATADAAGGGAESDAAGGGVGEDGLDEEFFLGFVTAVFTQRRKTMRNAIRNTAHISGLDDPDAVVDAADEPLMGQRAGTVTPAEFAALARLAREHGDPT